MILLITYDLKGTRNYTGFYDSLKSAPLWWHYLDSTWLIQTEDAPSTWFEKLKPHIDEGPDSLLIVEITKNYSGWLPRKAWDWIRDNQG